MPQREVELLDESDDQSSQKQRRPEAEDFSDFAEAANFSDILLNFRIFTAQISVRQISHCRNLDAELIDFSKRNEKLRHLI